jgi:flagellar biosynthesis protein FlhG
VPKLNLYDVIFNNKSIEDIILSGPEGIKVVPGGSGVESLSNLTDDQRKKLSDKFGDLKDTDILIVDTGAGISKNVLGFIAAADEVIIVTTPEPTSITDAYGLIKVALKYVPKSKLHVLVNRVMSDSEANLAYQRLGGAVKSFLKRDINYLGYVIDDIKVKKAVMQQIPFKVAYPDCFASRCVDDIASAIIGLPVTPLKKPGGIREFMNKVSYLFSKLDQ